MVIQRAFDVQWLFASTRSTAPRLAQVVFSWGMRGVFWAKRVMMEVESRQELRAMLALDDAQLKDLGVSRLDILLELRTPLDMSAAEGLAKLRAERSPLGEQWRYTGPWSAARRRSHRL